MRSVVKPAVKKFEAIGTHWVIEAFLSDTQFQDIYHIIDKYDQEFSRFRRDSMITAMSQQKGTYTFTYGQELFALYQSMYELTGGAVTPCIGGTLASMGYGADYSLIPQQQLHAPFSVEDTLIYRDNTITMLQPALLDFGAAGKGHLVDLISAYINEQSEDEYSVDAGGDIYVQGAQRIGLEHPTEAGQIIGYVNVHNQSICGSAGNRRAWDAYHHIVNPKTLEPVSDIAATWAIADNALIADGMATCLFFTDPEILQQRYNFEYVMVMQDGSARYSKNVPGELF